MSDKLRILIVEDEYMISEDIAMRLSDFGYSVSGIAHSGKDALEILEKGETDLALVDINIEGNMDGIELAGIINSTYKIPFIFLTSLASKSIVEKAKQTQPSAYLLKPFNDRQVQIAIEMALVNFSHDVKADISKQTPKESKQSNDDVVVIKDAFYVRKDNCYLKMSLNDVLYLAAEGSYTILHTEKGKHMHCQVLKYFDNILPSDKFIRIHRSYIVNFSAITKIEGNAVMLGKIVVPLSRMHKDELFKHLNVI